MSSVTGILLSNSGVATLRTSDEPESESGTMVSIFQIDTVGVQEVIAAKRFGTTSPPACAERMTDWCQLEDSELVTPAGRVIGGNALTVLRA